MSTAQLQTAVNIQYAYGVPGDLILDGPQRAQPVTLDANGATIGHAVTINKSTGIASQGGAITSGSVFGGIVANPKRYTSFGGTNPLDPTETLPGNSQAEALTMGFMVAQINGAFSQGDNVQYSNADGSLSSAGSGSATSGNTLVPNCTIYSASGSTSGLAAIKLTN